jgi:aarF domain-containing kinase
MILPKGLVAAAVVAFQPNILIVNTFRMCGNSKPLQRAVPRGGALVDNHNNINNNLNNRNHQGIMPMPFLGGVGHFVSNLLQPPIRIRTRDVLFAAVFLALSAGFILYSSNLRVRRSVDFWRRIAPIAAEYKWIQFKHNRLERATAKAGTTTTTAITATADTSASRQKQRMRDFHLKTAPKIASLMQDLGGMMIKAGQVATTMGAAFLDDAYLKALQPLQDGVKPRDYAEISKIITESSGQSMDQLFIDFDITPIGAASIGQVHKATLITGQQVVVKVQYPDVAQEMAVDFDNMAVAINYLNPDMNDFAKSIRKRHERELDFTLEADNLRHVAANMQAHGVEPTLVRIPRVYNETGLCRSNVLVMEYLEGMPLQKAISLEQERVAKALGHTSASDMKEDMRKQMQDYLEKGGSGDTNGEGLPGGASNKNKNNNNRMMGLLASPMAAQLLRLYTDAKEKVDDAGMFLTTATAKLARTIKGGDTNGGLVGAPLDNSNGAELAQAGAGKKQGVKNINLNRVIKVLIKVHGLQMIKDGVYNADPHPGNVIVMPCGRLGLLDYGMVVRLTPDERMNIAQTLVALSSNDKKATARVYNDGGYKAAWHKEGAIVDPNILHRFATFHFDRFDLSPIKQSNGTVIDVMDMFKACKETNIPLWVEEARRLNGLLLGVAHQAARPVSLAKEWKSIAHQAVRDGKK